MVAFAACSDAPTAAPESTTAATLPVPRAAIYVDYMDTVSAVKSADITVTPEGGWFQLGKTGVYFPANTICDPAKSTYGTTEWDKSCTVIRKPIKIHAELDTLNSSWIVFKPDLRFRPSANSDNWVYLFMYTPTLEGKYADASELEGKWKINWLPGNGLPAVDESLLDKTLRTRQYKNTGYVYRRVKHFSGYMVALGRSVTLEEGSGEEVSY
ncbi:MAG TPA: hypothetical protein VKA84_07100 [Gemmatimonadaceae bacterium]|nr:hypothetical protein [Gemmatimonadaceae bacterium]